MYPILFTLGPLEIRMYGVMIALAFIAAAWLGLREARRRGDDPELIHDFLTYAMIFGIVGARLYYVLVSEPGWYLAHPLEIPAVWKGGLAVHGGLLGGLVGVIWFTRRRGISFWGFADLLTPSVILGQAVGRGACVFNGCSYGKPTTLPWAITFTNPNAQVPLNIPLHPTQFYELVTDLLIFAVLWALRGRMRVPGQLFLLYGLSYGAARFVLEFFRGDSLLVAEMVPVAQVMSVAILLIAGLFLLRRLRTQPAT